MDFQHWGDLILNKLERWLQAFIKMLPNLVLAAFVLTIAYFIARLVRNITYKLTLRVSHSDSVSGVVSVIMQSLVMFLGITFGLQIVALDKAVTSLLAGVGVIGLALGFAFQDLSANFISGLYMAFRRPFEIGDMVETNAYTGTIKEIKLRSTTLVTTAGLEVIIPNKDIFQKPIINYSRSGERRIVLEFTVPNTLELPFAESIIRKVLPFKDVEFYYTAIEDPKVKVTLTFRMETTDPKEFMRDRHQAIVGIQQALAANNVITVSVPNKEKATQEAAPGQGNVRQPQAVGNAKA